MFASFYGVNNYEYQEEKNIHVHSDTRTGVQAQKRFTTNEFDDLLVDK